MVIEMLQVGRRFGRRQVLQGVDLTAREGAVTGLLGPNGAGKSTTLRVLLGLLRPHGGQVRLFGEPWRREHLARVGASVDGPSFYGHLTGRQNVALHARLVGVGAAAVGEALETVGLGAAADQRASGYSTGMRSRLALAIALLGDPDLVVLDEPQNGLDPSGVREVRELVRRLARDGRTVLFSSHLLSEVAAVADDVTCLAAGRTVFAGPLSALAPDGDLESAYFQVTAGRAAR
ncbi:ABC transporter ATP-binding protein [Cellulomonas xiejunii]|uniref:ATP-binding cassette domain-containing protein n=1 Tax=Cellulomonas xiejunii TaxID=2968083 RepID=A0ABY5KVD5_9CELL|nr:ATP-binding cassette domain-containing protein [Cellulomonas xiejunii]MCC2322240.1 ATP-binding cassette domain-containing protein [Cellulomonas xiejunii]UUI72293.1 ATP-binding cassette domain-containing protein [Cellulomonas xiejunii]